MPTYEYLCQVCDHRFERFQRMTDAPEKTCPVCSGEVRRLIFPAGVIFKGSGFYITDSRKATEPAASKNGDQASDAKSDSKSEPAGGASSTAGAGSTKEAPATKEVASASA